VYYIQIKRTAGGPHEETWSSQSLLRIGRLESLEVFLDDTSVSRRHAEIRATAHGWRLRDTGSTNGTYLNGTRVTSNDWPLKAHDIIRCGNVTLVVDSMRDGARSDTPNPEHLVVEATARASWEEALAGLAYDRHRVPRPGEQMLALLRASHHLGSHQTEEELLHSILNDAVATLEAQRGVIVLAQGPNHSLELRALAAGSEVRGETPARPGFSQSLAQRCFARGESLLCQSVEDDPELVGAPSIAAGAMASVICALLRTPRKRIGVLHLDRSPFQKPFTRDDLHLADALAASVSAGIESAQLLREQRELFLKTITILAQAVELRDELTGDHTVRVTNLAAMVARHLQVSPAEQEWILMGTPLHDIGKIGIDDAILRKPGRVTADEFEIMKTHTVKGAAILATIPDLAPIIPIARSHHERWDGRGYPDGLRGEEINRLARIVAVADAFDAMTSDRPYRNGMPPEDALEELRRQSGQQFDPACVAAMLELRESILQDHRSRPARRNMNEVTACLTV
jgi:putative nucleotidyltransferase with HDIG domain